MCDASKHGEQSGCEGPDRGIPMHRPSDAAILNKDKNQWYVIQVPTGKELALCEILQRVVGEDVLTECFSPRYATEKKVKGAWVSCESLLLPGYIVVVTGDVETLHERLRSVDEFTRLLRFGDAFCTLEESDRAWLSEFTGAGDRVIPMSMGVMEGDRVVVFRGPLKGREACIRSINRRKSLAYIELDMCGRRITTRIGLGIVRKRQCPGESRTT